jgi:hypothetical protein
MAHRTLLISGHIVGMVPVDLADGTRYTHIVLDDDAAGQATVDALRLAGVVIHDTKTDDAKTLDAKFQGHEFYEAEFKPRTTVTVRDPAEAEAEEPIKG